MSVARKAYTWDGLGLNYRTDWGQAIGRTGAEL